MQAENWTTIKEVLEQALNLAPSERGEFFRDSDIAADIRQEVESLLTHEKDAKDFMSLTAGGFSGDFFNGNGHSENSLIGQRIGVYEIVGELGYGGMGAVYLGTRADGKFAQRVAVKLLRREYNIEKIRRNFEREKEILATLVHPNIATLIDAGTTTDGVPFLVMEYIEGVPVDKFCHNRNLSLTERLKLFNKICLAVGFAHQNLVVHRDLKPSNILVTEDGEPKLLDFGISKLLDAEQKDDKTAITMLGAMTPEYASPEQIKGEQVTTAADIYSLGVILFKILTDNFPYNFKDKTNGNLLKEITDSAPMRPSVAVNFIFDKAHPKSHIPNPKSLSGDLDNIILKSLSKEPERRYKTVEQFSADIWRFIDGLPVLARPATLSYRANKFFKRNKISVIAAVLIFLSLITGIIAAFRQTKIAEEQTNIAVESRNLAERETVIAKAEQEKSEKISKFMAKIISYANPAWYAEGAKFGGNAKVIDALDDLSDKIDIEFTGQPDVQAELHHKFAEVYNFVKQFEKDPARVESYVQKNKFHALSALELRKQFYGTRHELVAKDLFYAFRKLGKDDREQSELLMQAIIMMKETNLKNLNLPYMLESYAISLAMDEYSHRQEAYRQSVLPATNLGRYEIAEQYFEEMLELFRFHYEEGNYAIIITNCSTAIVELKLEKIAEAAEHYKICKEAKNKFTNEFQTKAIREQLEQIEKVLAAKNGEVSK